MIRVIKERRGSKLNKILDWWLGSFLILVLVPLIAIKRAVSQVKNQNDAFVVVCFGAIGDLILLTEAVRARKPSSPIVLACSKLNYEAASIFDNVFESVEIVDLRNPMSLKSICHKHKVANVIDSTQWANIGPLQIGFAKLFLTGVNTVGFKTRSRLRNAIYDVVVDHGRSIHEFLNFMNLLELDASYQSNILLDTVLPHLYASPQKNQSMKLLFHMWPSGNRSYLKAWPQTSWNQLIRACVQQGYTIYLSGSPADSKQTLALIKSFDPEKVVSIAGQYSLRELFNFIAREIQFVVSVNTGILHLAAATGVPVIGLHGAVNPQRWGPLGKQSISLLPRTGKSAYLHYGFEYPKDDQDAYVLDRLSVDQVLNAISSLE